MIIVTGGAGFIGANLIKALNRRGISDILVVDDLADGDKVRNLSDLRIGDYMDKDAFLAAAQRGDWPEPVTAVLHQGACADTMATDGRYVMENNFAYSKALYHFCARQRAQYLYASSASVYGGGDAFAEEPRNESALNPYAWSKLLFDQFVRRVHLEQPRAAFQCVGLRYFNVYGAREQHKGAMASVARHFFEQYRRRGQVRLFAASGGCADGEQRRDFVSVEDIAAVNLFFLDHPDRSGIYNVGTGRSSTFNQVAVAVINACRRHRGQPPTSLRQAVREAEIRYVPMPSALHGKYQHYTEADLTKLRAAGCDHAFRDVAQGVGEYVDELWRAFGD